MSEPQTENMDLRLLQQQLQQALVLIEQSTVITNANHALEDTYGMRNTTSLLARCEQLVTEKKSNKKPVLRIIHHFACSGGTLISKCIAAQPNVFLLSELHPTTRLGLPEDKAIYTPHDIVSQAIFGNIPNVDDLAEKLFIQNIIETEKHVSNRGGYLVLRAHTHADYCTNEELPDLDSLNRLLSTHFTILNLVTVRNPIDSFLSLKQNGWLHFKPDNFDEYCKRLLSFLKPFDKGSIIKYEDFVERPECVVKVCAEMLALPFIEYAFDYIEVFKISGDSGRTGTEISARNRREISQAFREEIDTSTHYEKYLQFQKFLETVK